MENAIPTHLNAQYPIRDTTARTFALPLPRPRPAPIPVEVAEDPGIEQDGLTALWEAVAALQRSDERDAVMEEDEQRRLAILEATLAQTKPSIASDFLSRITSRKFIVTVLSTAALIVGALQQAFVGDARISGALTAAATVITSVWLVMTSKEDTAKIRREETVQTARIAAAAGPEAGVRR